MGGLDRQRQPARALAVSASAVIATVVVLGLNVVTTTDLPFNQLLPGGAGAPPSVGSAGAAEATAGSGTPGEGRRAQESPDLADWAANVSRAVDRSTLADAGLVLPYGANVLAARVVDGVPSPAYSFYEAGGGGFTNAFYPASSIKLLAALGALHFTASSGFTGEAVIDGGPTVHDIYDAALRYSSNDDYSWLVRIAGVEWLNREFLPSQGYWATAIQEAYGGEYEQVAYSPEMTLTEGDREADVPARSGYDDYGCGGTNCTDLFDMVDALRRVVLDAKIPAPERFAIAPSDIAGLQDALLGTDSWIGPGVWGALGPDALVFSKPGWVGGLDCVDVALVSDPVTGRRYLIGLSAPDYGDGCDGLASTAYDVLTVLSAIDGGEAMRTDGSTVAVVNGKQVAARP